MVSSLTVVTSEQVGRLRVAVWLGLGVQILGKGVDAWWHSTHPGFEDAADLLRAHSLIYLGIVWALVASSRGLLRTGKLPGLGNRGFFVTLIGSAGQFVGSAWDFWAHSLRAEASTAHMVNALGLIVVLLGALVLLGARAPRRSGVRGE